ncbi:MAG: hypothetical protein ACK5C3_04080 [bacterium]
MTPGRYSSIGSSWTTSTGFSRSSGCGTSRMGPGQVLPNAVSFCGSPRSAEMSSRARAGTATTRASAVRAASVTRQPFAVHATSTGARAATPGWPEPRSTIHSCGPGPRTSIFGESFGSEPDLMRIDGSVVGGAGRSTG